MSRLVCCVVVVGGAWASGCDAPGDGVIDTVFDACEPLLLEAKDGTAAQRDSIATAARLWNEAAATRLSVEPQPSTAAATDEPHSAVVPVFFDPAGAAFHGLYDDKAGVIYINEGIDGDGARTVTVAHEIGHAFGLFHVDVDEDVSVMNDGNLVTAPNDFDVAQLRKLWGACADPQQ